MVYLKNSYFAPVDTPNFKSNIDAAEAASFLQINMFQLR